MQNPAIPPITENEIVQYLANTPDFFARHAELLAAVQLTSPHGSRAVSLQERQVELLRERLRQLELRSATLLRYAQDNQAIADKLHAWTCDLVHATVAGEPRTWPDSLAQRMAERFAVPQVAVRLWGVAPGFEAEPFAHGVSEDVRALAASLASPYRGANPDLEPARWLADPRAVASLALVPLRGSGGARTTFGLLVLASNDPQRFTPDMGVDFLLRIGELASAALTRLRSAP